MTTLLTSPPVEATCCFFFVVEKKKNNNYFFFVHLVGALLSADGVAFWAQSICTAIERESAILPSFFRK